MSVGSERLINDIVDHPHFERIRGEILSNINYRSKEAQQAFTGLMTFCGVIYTGGTIAILSFIGTRSSSGVSYLALASFGCFVAALLSFAIFYQRYSQLASKRHEHYTTVAQAFFTRNASLESVLAAGSYGQSRWLFRLIFWVPLAFAASGFILGALGAIGFGPIAASPIPSQL